MTNNKHQRAYLKDATAKHYVPQTSMSAAADDCIEVVNGANMENVEKDPVEVTEVDTKDKLDEERCLV